MPIYRGSQKVTPRRAGVDLARVYRGDRLVWRRIITVTPQAPTFLDAAPWIELPTVEGVTYTVAGTPGAGESVTVTATAGPGYALDGTTQWTHTWPLPRYRASNSTSSRRRINSNTWTTMDTHTVTHAGIASGQWQAQWRQPAYSSYYQLRVRRGGTVLAEVSQTQVSSLGWWQSLTIPTTTLAAGDVLIFEARTTGTGTTSREVDAWSWYLS